MRLPTTAKWSGALVLAFVVGLAAFFLKDTYESSRAKQFDHDVRLQAEERTTAVTALQLTLMQKQLDRIESKLDAVVARR